MHCNLKLEEDTSFITVAIAVAVAIEKAGFSSSWKSWALEVHTRNRCWESLVAQGKFEGKL